MAAATKSRPLGKTLGFVEEKPKKKSGTAPVKPKKEVRSLQDEWDEKLQTPRSKDLLAGMAAKALAKHKASKTERGGFGK
jgi:hypothetical protein